MKSADEQTQRPDIYSIKSGQELKNWYWLKNELIAYCKIHKISYLGSKFEILARIADKMDNINHPQTAKQLNSTSNFDWQNAKLSPQTLITDNYKNSQNVRHFFQQHCGDKFHFSIPFMDFMKQNWGKTLQEAINYWRELQTLAKDKNFKSTIPAGNQYNQYMRDFFAANPHLSPKEAKKCWQAKRNLPQERHFYENSDLQFL